MSSAAITVEGFIARDLTFRTAGTHEVIDVTVPVTPQKNDGGKWVDAGETVWFDATFWDDHARALLMVAEKGSLVQISGTPTARAYLKKDGTPASSISIDRPTIAVVVRRPAKGSQQPSAPVQSTVDESWAASPAGYADAGSELPF